MRWSVGYRLRWLERMKDASRDKEAGWEVDGHQV